MKIPSHMVYATKEDTVAGWQAWKEGSKSAYEKLQCTAAKIALSAAESYLARASRASDDKMSREDKEECRSEAVLMSLGVINRWEPALGHLSTFVTRSSEGAIINFINRESNRGMASSNSPHVVQFEEENGCNEDFDDDGNMHNVSPDREPGREPSPEETLIAYEEVSLKHKAVHEALKSLVNSDRELIRRYYGIGCDRQTQTQIANRTGISQSAIHQRIGRIEEKLSNYLKSVGGISL